MKNLSYFLKKGSRDSHYPIALRKTWDSHKQVVNARRHVRSHVRLSTQCKIPSTNENSPVPTSLSTMQLQMPNRNSVAANATLVTVTFCFITLSPFHNFALSGFFLNEAFQMVQQQETLYFGYTHS